MLPLPPTKIASTHNLNLFDMISYLESPIIVGTCDNFLATYDCGKHLLLMQLLYQYKLNFIENPQLILKFHKSQIQRRSTHLIGQVSTFF